MFDNQIAHARWEHKFDHFLVIFNLDVFCNNSNNTQCQGKDAGQDAPPLWLRKNACLLLDYSSNDAPYYEWHGMYVLNSQKKVKVNLEYTHNFTWVYVQYNCLKNLPVTELLSSRRITKFDLRLKKTSTHVLTSTPHPITFSLRTGQTRDKQIIIFIFMYLYNRAR